MLNAAFSHLLSPTGGRRPVTLAFRRWRTPDVRLGRPSRRWRAVRVVEVEVVDPAAITDEEARARRLAGAARLRKQLDKVDASVRRRTASRWCGPDPARGAAGGGRPDRDADVAAIDARLERLDWPAPTERG